VRYPQKVNKNYYYRSFDKTPLPKYSSKKEGKYRPCGPKYWSICTPGKSPFNPTFCQTEMSFQENIDSNMKFGFIFMIIDEKITF
jgi:hypothetical protein